MSGRHMGFFSTYLSILSLQQIERLSERDQPLNAGAAKRASQGWARF